MKKHLDIVEILVYNAFQGLYIICYVVCFLCIFAIIWCLFILSDFILLCFEDNAKSTCVDEAISQYIECLIEDRSNIIY